MPTDLNLIISDIKKTSIDVEKKLKDLFSKYSTFYREAQHQYEGERSASGVKGLEDFYRLVQTTRRNRDVVGSLVRGIENLRPITEFRWVEEDIPEIKSVKPQQQEKTVPESPIVEVALDDVSVPELISAVEALKEEEQKEEING